MLPIYLVRVLKDVIVDGVEIKPFLIVSNFFLAGNSGPGSYYLPCLLMLVLIFPIILKIVEKYQEYGLVLILIAETLYEIACVHFSISPSLYRNLVFRYVFTVSGGCYLYLYGERINKLIASVSLGCGAAYIISVAYFGWNPAWIHSWKDTSYLTAFWVIPILWVVLVKNRKFCFANKTLHKILTNIGKASYHIFCVQLLWFVSGIDRRMTNNLLIQLLVSEMVCLTAGYIYYRLEVIVMHKN